MQPKGEPGQSGFKISGGIEHKPILRQVSGSPGSHWLPPLAKRFINENY